MIKEFVLKQLLKAKLKDVPKEMQERLIAGIEKDPDFFAGLAKEIETEVKKGKPQMAAAMLVMKKHQQKLRELLA